MNIEEMINRGVAHINPYIFGKPKEEVENRFNVKESIKLNSNENPFGVSPRALDYALKTVPQSNMYPEATNRILRDMLSELFSLGSENFIIGSGADEVIYYIAMAFINDDDEVIIPKITFPLYEIAFTIMRAQIITSPMNGYTIDLKGILDRITEKTKIVVVCNPNNPTGHLLERAEIENFIEAVPKKVLIVMDEAYMEFANPERFPDTVSLFRGGFNNLIILRTLSKAYGLAGFRVGYGIAERGIVEIMNRIKLPFNVSLVSQYAAVGALQDTRFLEETVSRTKSERGMLCKSLKKMNLSYVESSTNFILVDVKKDSDLITNALEKRGIIVRSAKNYGASTSIRVTIGKREQNEKFIRALGEALKEC